AFMRSTLVVTGAAVVFFGLSATRLWAADLTKGMQLYHQGDYKGAENELAQVVQADPQNAEAYRYLGLARAEQHNTSGAAEALKQADELAPSGATKLAMARLYTEQKDYAKAEAALADGASGDEVDYVLGLIRLGQGKNDEAVRNLEAFISKNPDHAYAHY